jgi:hypothetical protein
VYSTCLFCHAPLGANGAVEHFPVGRRIAFDAAKGRLWAVCVRCGRWNLSPLEERWEAIEECERLYRGTRLRASTDNVGLARLPDGTELVRIGSPLRPEFAAWRYGDQFGRRRRRHLAYAGLSIAGAAAFAAGWHALGLGGGIAYSMFQIVRAGVSGSPDKVVATIPQRLVPALKVRRRDVARAYLNVQAPGDSWTLWVQGTDGGRLIGADRAERVAGTLLAASNHAGASALGVRHAVAVLEEAGNPGAVGIPFLVRRARRRLAYSEWTPVRFGELTGSERLALEMALHEESERRALEGELASLAEAWREAEEVAAIADSLLLPAGLDERIARLRAEASSPPSGAD